MEIGRCRVRRLQSPHFSVSFVSRKTYRRRVAGISAARKFSSVVCGKNNFFRLLFLFCNSDEICYEPRSLVAFRVVYYNEEIRAVNGNVNVYGSPLLTLRRRDNFSVSPTCGIAHQAYIDGSRVVNSKRYIKAARRVNLRGVKISVRGVRHVQRPDVAERIVKNRSDFAPVTRVSAR